MAASNTEVWQTATVVAVETIAEDIRRIELELELPAPAAPGSHLDVEIPVGGEAARRSYSVVDASADGSRVALSVFKAPASRGGSEHMHTLAVGDRFAATQPLQNFPLRVGAGHYLLVAGGIGITAIANMARVLKATRADYTLVYAGRTREAMAYLEQLSAEHGERLEVHVDAEGTSLDVAETVGRAGPDTELYMCGPIRLMDAVRRAWEGRGLPVPNLRFETFGNSGWYDPEDFIVRIPRLGVEATVTRGRSMLEALEGAGVDMMFDCRKGECGLCEVRILDLDGRLDHRDVFYSRRQQAAEAKMCVCVSRAVADTGTAETAPDPAPCPRRGAAVVTIDVS